MKNGRNNFKFLIVSFKFSNSKLRIKNLKFIPVCAALFFAAAPNEFAQPTGVGGADDFTSVEYFEAPHAQQIRSRLSGAQALPQAGGLLIIKQLKLEMFGEDGTLEWLVTAPECVYDSMNFTANSAGHLQLQTGDGQVRVEGDGFLWRQNDSFLTISNNVKTLIIALVAAADVSASSAQTNSTLPLPHGMTRIDAESADFDLTRHKATYRSHVRVNDPGMKLYCEWLVVDLPQAGGRVNHIVAETNVVIDLADEKGQTNHATGDMAVYDYNVQGSVTNDTVTLTGDPQIKNSMGAQSGDKIVWNRISNKFYFTNPKGVLRQNLNGATMKTNSSAAATNFPPGTIQNIDRISSPVP
jgi:lipopolysaccharide export system protein LptA